MDKKYNEFRVTGKVVGGKFQITKKEPTERGKVMISKRDAEVNNLQTRFTLMHYELAEDEAVEVKKPGRPKKTE